MSDKKSIFNNADSLVKMTNFIIDSGNIQSFVAETAPLGTLGNLPHFFKD
ncbi:hypothetical protein [Paenibacillus sp. Leaf72]|nr:hypothetical protein [Paenibacillus sp. Leaf72]